METCTEIKRTSPCDLIECMCNAAFVPFIDNALLSSKCSWPKSNNCSVDSQECNQRRDDVLLRDKIRTIRNWLTLLDYFTSSTSQCYDHALCKKMATSFIPNNATLTTPLGIFVGGDEWCEFVGLTTHHVSRQFLSTRFPQQISDKDISGDVSIRLRMVIAKVNGVSMVFPIDTTAKFFPCTDVLTSFEIKQNNNSKLLHSGYAMASRQHIDHMDNSTLVWICRNLETLCGYQDDKCVDEHFKFVPSLVYINLMAIDPEKYCKPRIPKTDLYDEPRDYSEFRATDARICGR